MKLEESRVLVIGPGPFAIDHGGELDAAVCAALDVLRGAVAEVVLVTSNPATRSSDPSLAHRTYLEPLDDAALHAVVLRERPHLIFPLVGGRRALELAAALDGDGTLARTGTKLLGITAEAARRALATDAAAARAGLTQAGAWTSYEVVAALDERRFVAVSVIESLDGAAIHAGDAIGVSPPLSLTAARRAVVEEATEAALRALGLETGVATVDVAVPHGDGRVVVLGITPGLGRATAAASIATSWNLAEVTVDVALGRAMPAGAPAHAGEVPPVTVRWPRFAFETFPDAEASLGPIRKSLGESVGTGATVADALRSAARGADDGRVRRRTAHASPASSAGGVVIVGAGPSRIGAGPELATNALECILAMGAAGVETVFVDSSLDALSLVRAAAPRGTRVRLGPVTVEHVVEVAREEGATRVMLQVGGDAALRLGPELAARGLTVLGTSPDAASRALAHGRDVAPPELDDATGFDVDAVSDGRRVMIVGVTEHLEPAFVHGGDAAAILPPSQTRPDVVVQIEDLVRALALDLRIVGCLAARVIVKGAETHVTSIEPRAGRTTPFVTRATSFPIVRVATEIVLGKTLEELGVTEPALPRHVCARERVFPFERLGVDPALGREMRSTGEVIGIDDTPARAYGKALRAIGINLRAPASGAPVDAPGASPRGVILDVTNHDRSAGIELARRLRSIGFEIFARGGTRDALTYARIPFHDVGDDDVTRAIGEVRAGTIALAIVTARGDDEVARTRALRGATQAARIPCITTVALARLACAALEEDSSAARVRPLQEWYAADA